MNEQEMTTIQRVESDDRITIALDRPGITNLLGAAVTPTPSDPQGTYLHPASGLMPDQERKRAEEVLSAEPNAIITQSEILARTAQLMVARGQIEKPVDILDSTQEDGQTRPIWVEIENDGNLSRELQPGFCEVAAKIVVDRFPYAEGEK